LPVSCRSSDIFVRSGPVKNVDSAISVSPVESKKEKSTEEHSRANKTPLQ
jgi:hypothetical protein